MTSVEIRQAFLDFFKSKQHTIVPSSSLLPDAPNLLFTNAGMNQFVPIFLGQHKADVDKWPGAVPALPTRAADTQKCIRAGGKHNDLDDVGLDTYHHTFFEMLGNWSFGDYFKKEAIEWAWELVVGRWKFPAQRLYATVYQPGPGDPAEFDQEAYDHWARLFAAAGLDPQVHIVHGGKKDNFWMMGDTGPCGPCSEIHVDLTPAGDTKGSLVNQGDARCIEIWNLVFIQLNANPDGTFSPLPAKHVDTGMGFERVTSIIQGTRGFTDFANAKISNYGTDIFRPIFDAIEKLSGRKYGSTLPPPDLSTINSQQSTDVAFRVVADHIRTLSFAIADGIQPGNTDRNYVLRRILRRAVRYGRILGFGQLERSRVGPDEGMPNVTTETREKAAFLPRLVDTLIDSFEGVFPELRTKRNSILSTLFAEEDAFNKTLDSGLQVFEDALLYRAEIQEAAREVREYLELANSDELRGEKAVLGVCPSVWDISDAQASKFGSDTERNFLRLARTFSVSADGLNTGPRRDDKESENGNDLEMYTRWICEKPLVIGGNIAFLLYDTYGFPLDLTELIARERGLTVDKNGFERLMEEQRARARAAQKREVISLSKIDTHRPTVFVGFNRLEDKAKVLEVIDLKGKPAVILDATVFYAEMGGQVGDTGKISIGDQSVDVIATQKVGNTFVHFLIEAKTFSPGAEVELKVDRPRRAAIQRHHTVTHLFHWALHEVASKDASQKGSYVGPEKLTFDFNSAPLTPQQIAEIEKLVNERILENAGVSWIEAPYADVKSRKDVLQFFGDKYGDTVRVVQIGGNPQALDGYSMELCGGTHTRATGEIGLFRIVAESAIAAGVRRIEAVAGLEAYRKANDELHLIKTLAGQVNSPVADLEKKIEALLAHQKELEKQVKIAMQRNASNAASELLGRAQTVNGTPLITHNLGDADSDFLQAIADALKGRFKGVVVLGGCSNTAVTLVATVSPEFMAKVQAGKIIQQIAPLVGGKGGGRPDNARGGGKDAGKLDEALTKAKELLG